MSVDNLDLRLFPEMAGLPAMVIQKAIRMELNDVAGTYTKAKNGPDTLKRGAYNAAQVLKKYVIKRGEADNMNATAECVNRWLNNIFSDPRADKLILLARQFVTPTVVLFDNVVIQKRVKLVADSIPNIHASPLRRKIQDVAYALGIGDMHEGNWGLDKKMLPKIFDIGSVSNPRPKDIGIGCEDRKMILAARKMDRLIHRIVL